MCVCMYNCVFVCITHRHVRGLDRFVCMSRVIVSNLLQQKENELQKAHTLVETAVLLQVCVCVCGGVTSV